MNVHVSGLEPSRDGRGLVRALADEGREARRSCGRFTVHEGVTTVRAQRAVRLTGYDGWIVTRRGSDEPLLTT